MKFQKITSIILYVLMAISVIFMAMFFFGSELTLSVETSTTTKTFEYPAFTSLFIQWGYVLVAISTLSVLIFSIAFMVSDLKKAKTSLLGILALVIVFGIGYVIASDSIPTVWGEKVIAVTTTGISKFVGTGLWTMYILGFLAIGSIFYVEISKALK